MRLQRNKNRMVVPFAGELFKQIERNFANIPVLNAKGQKLIDPETKKIKTTRAKEVTLPFIVYNSLVSIDEYMVSKVEEMEDAKGSVNSDLAIRFAAAWRFILRRWAPSAPKGMRDNCVKIERLLHEVDNSLTLSINDRQSPLNQKITSLKAHMNSAEGKKLLLMYSDFMKDLFKTFRMEVSTSVKMNARVGVRYYQFRLGTQISSILEAASSTEQARIQKAVKTAELRDLKLKAQLDNMGCIVESVPMYEDEGKPIFALVAYDPKMKSIPAPKVPSRKKFNETERLLIKKLYPNQKGLYSILPKDPTSEQVESNQQIIEFIEAQLSAQLSIAKKEYKAGYGLNPDGTPQAVDSLGRPIIKYTRPESDRREASKVAKVLQKLLHNQTLNRESEQTRAAKEAYRKKIEPFIRGVFHPKFTSETGTQYEVFDSMNDLRDKMVKKRASEKFVEAVTPIIGTTKIAVKNYPKWNDITQKIDYVDTDIQVAEISYPSGTSYVAPRYTAELNQVDWDKDEIITKEIRDFGDGVVLGGIARSVKTKQIVVDGSPKSLILSGRYAGYLLENIINIEGRFIEGGYILKTNGENKEVPLVEDRMIVKDGKVQTIDFLSDSKVEQRLIEPYITLSEDGQRLLLGVPGGRATTLDQHIMNELSEKIATIERVSNPDIPNNYHKARNPFYVFTVDNFETIRKSLGSVAVSRAASDFIDNYYETLRSKEAAMAVENLERFTPASLGGFIKKSDRGPFLFNNKQLEALAWLDAGNLQGVVGLDTGVGKTLTALAAIKNAINQEMFEGLPERKFLFVSPARLVGNLQKEIEAFMDKGGDQVILADGSTDTSPNWVKIISDRVVEMSYDKFTETFQDFGGQFARSEEGSALIKEKTELDRSLRLQGRPVNPQEPEGETYPIFEDDEIAAKKKRIREINKEMRKLQKALVVESFPKADKYFQKSFYACFFDEVNEALVGDKRKALASLKHPRKVFLTASTMQKDPVDLYRFVTLAKGADYSEEDEKAFTEKYGNVVGGRFVGIKKDPATQKEFLTWVKENAFFAFKESVNYEEVGLPKLLPKTTRTITVQMPAKVQAAYRQEAAKVKRELDAMVKKYRDLSKSLAIYDDSTDIDFNTLDAKWVGRGKKRQLQKQLLQDFAQNNISPVLKKLIRLSNRPGSLVKGAKNVKVDQSVALAKEYRTTKTLYFTSDKFLAIETGTEISKALPAKVHAVCLPEEIRFYQAGKLLYNLKSKFNMTLEQFQALEVAKIIKKSSEMDEEEVEATWAMDISKEYIKNNTNIGTAICTDAYAFGFNFQTFTKVIHLDRGEGFNSEVVKQRTARAYRAGQDVEVEEIFIDAALVESSDTKSDTSESSKTQVSENISIDELKGMVAHQDQDFFMEIIRESLAMDLTAGREGIQQDTTKTVNFTNEMLSSILDPTPSNITALERELDDFEKNPVKFLALSPKRFEKSEVLVDGVPVSELPQEKKDLLDLAGFSQIGGKGQNIYLSEKVASIKSDVAEVWVSVNENNIYFNSIEVRKCSPPGTGLKVVLNTLITAIKMKKNITATAYGAAGNRNQYSGALVWGKMGFDGNIEINPSVEGADKLIQLLGPTASVLDILATELEQGDKFGQKWWAKNAESFKGVFDVSPNSKSMMVANTYLKLKCEQLGLSVQDFLSTPLDPINVDDPGCWWGALGEDIFYEGEKITFDELISMYPAEFRTAWYSTPEIANRLKLWEARGVKEPGSYQVFLKKYKLRDVAVTPSSSRMASEAQQADGVDISDDPILDAAWEVIRRRHMIINKEIERLIDEGNSDITTIEKLRGAK